MTDSTFQERGQIDLPAGKGDDKEGSDQLHSTRRMVASTAQLMLQYLSVCTFLKALEKAGVVERVRMLSATKRSKDDCTAEVFEDCQVQYFLTENPTTADDEPVTKDHKEIPASGDSVLPYSAGCIPLPAPGGGKGSVADSESLTVTKNINEEDLNSSKPVASTAKLMLQYLCVCTFLEALVASTAELMLQYLCVRTFLKALEKAGLVERVQMLLTTKRSKDDCTAEVFEDCQVQYFLAENPTTADDGPVTKDHEKIPASSDSVLHYSAGCLPLPAPGGGKGLVADSGNFTLTKDTNGDDLSSETPGPPLEICHSITHATCNRSGSGSDDSDSPTPPPHTNTFIEYNHDEEEEGEVHMQAPVEVSSVNHGSWSYTFDHIPCQYTTDDQNIPPHFLTSPVEGDPANIVKPQPVSSPLDTGQQASQHPLAKPPRKELHHHGPLDTGQQVSQHPLAKPPRMERHQPSLLGTGQQPSQHPLAKPPRRERHQPSLEEKKEVLVTPEEESVMSLSEAVITHKPAAGDDRLQQTPPVHGPFPSPSALDDQHSITDHHVCLTTPVEESAPPGASACLVTGLPSVQDLL